MSVDSHSDLPTLVLTNSPSTSTWMMPTTILKRTVWPGKPDWNAIPNLAIEKETDSATPTDLELAKHLAEQVPIPSQGCGHGHDADRLLRRPDANFRGKPEPRPHHRVKKF